MLAGNFMLLGSVTRMTRGKKKQHQHSVLFGDGRCMYETKFCLDAAAGFTDMASR